MDIPNNVPNANGNCTASSLTAIGLAQASHLSAAIAGRTSHRRLNAPLSSGCASSLFVTPTARSLKFLREEGYLPAVVESFNSFTKQRKDLFNFIDIVALRKDETLAIQATSRSNISSRVKKIAESEHVGAVREANWRIEVWGWAKINGRWQLKRVDCS